MSPPDTNIPKQTRRHRPALLGMAAAVISVLLILLLIMYLAPDDSGDVAPLDGDAETATE